MCVLDDLVDRAGDAAEVALVDVGVDVEGGLDVVVIDDDGRVVAAEGGEIAEQLAGVAGGEVTGVRASSWRVLMR